MLREALEAALGREITPDAVEAWCEQHKDQPVNGYILRKIGTTKEGKGIWRVQPLS
jgi:hypothetical protein